MAKAKELGGQEHNLAHFEKLAITAIESLRDNQGNDLTKSQQKDLARLAEEEGVITFLASIMQTNESDGNVLTKEQLFEDLVDLFDILKYATDENHFDDMFKDPQNKKYKLEEDTQKTIKKLTDSEIHNLYLAFHGEHQSFGANIFNFLKNMGHALLPIFKQVAAVMIEIGAKALADLVGDGQVGDIVQEGIKDVGNSISKQLRQKEEGEAEAEEKAEEKAEAEAVEAPVVEAEVVEAPAVVEALAAEALLPIEGSQEEDGAIELVGAGDVSA